GRRRWRPLVREPARHRGGLTQPSCKAATSLGSCRLLRYRAAMQDAAPRPELAPASSPASELAAGPAAGFRPTRAALSFIFVTVVVAVMALGIIIPVLPRLVESMAGGDTARAAALIGIFGTTWGLMQFVSSPVLGALSDRYGRRPVLLLSTLGLGLDY